MQFNAIVIFYFMNKRTSSMTNRSDWFLFFFEKPNKSTTFFLWKSISSDTKYKQKLVNKISLPSFCLYYVAKEVPNNNTFPWYFGGFATRGMIKFGSSVLNFLTQLSGSLWSASHAKMLKRMTTCLSQSSNTVTLEHLSR